MKIVDVEFSIEANEETIAAVSAAKAKPLSPTGSNCNNHGYALSVASADGVFCKAKSP